ncbi:cytochrome d ubiquinol oxidase subunit II [Acidicapsa ligni]|uniref:cytochrome d ubiquinol oxidase subunit II n=1 Tax=Acidicapsa ligni TaxID=542300 RepID=UPI0021DFEAE8|nr:cytochrome d ubiquinol oxidase subunit II [Acidicapsa ligni]
MGTIWFWIVALMLTAYVVFDGFDLGVGAVYLWVARTESERSQALRSIGPVWDGNEVWLIAAGGTLFFAFPLLYATAFSGFYLPLMIVLWLIILRGISIELRGHSSDPLWRTFFEALFCVSSALLTVFFGAALANVVRGVPIGADGYFFLPLWTDFRTGDNPGILDWYTVLGGVTALTALSLHGVLYLAMKTQGNVEERAMQLSKYAWIATAVLSATGIPATILARPASLTHYLSHPIAFIFPFMAFACLVVLRFSLSKGLQFSCFLASCGYLSSMFLGAAFGIFPVILPSVGIHGKDLTIDQALSAPHTLRVGLVWWSVGICLAVMYFCIVYRLFRGKVSVDDASYEH